MVTNRLYRSPEKQFQLITQSHDYSVTLIKRLYLLLGDWMLLLCLKLQSCAKFGWFWPSGFGEEYSKISSMYLCYFVIISPGKRIMLLTWINWYTYTQGCFGQIWLKLGKLFERSWFWISFINSRKFLIISPWINVALHLKKKTREYPSPNDDLSRVCLKIGSVVLKNMNMLKVYRQTGRQTDRRTKDKLSEKLTWDFSSDELKIPISLIILSMSTTLLSFFLIFE